MGPAEQLGPSSVVAYACELPRSRVVLGVPAPVCAGTSQAGDRLGVSVAGAGDVNGDGYDDVIVSDKGFLFGDRFRTTTSKSPPTFPRPPGVSR